MSKVARIAQVALSLMMMSAFGWSAPLPGFTLTAQTARFSFYTRGAKVDAEKSEQYLTKLEGLLGQSFTGKAEYYRYQNTTDLAVATGSYAEGVTYTHKSEIHSVQDFHAHEIVHLVAGQMGNPGALFQEGLAVVLGNDAKWNGQDVDKVAKKAVHRAPATELLAKFEAVDAQVAYPVAASFVRSLIAKHGLPKLTEFFRSCVQPQQREAAFQKTYGVAYAQAVNEWAQAL